MAATKSMSRILVFALLPLLSAGCALHTTSAPLEVGDLAPHFELADHEGTVWNLEEMTSEGPAAVLFYRGYW